MALTGHSLIAGESVPGTGGTTQAVDPATGQTLDPVFTLVGTAEVERATRAAQEAFRTYRDSSPEVRAGFLEAAASRIDEARDELSPARWRRPGCPRPG